MRNSWSREFERNPEIQLKIYRPELISRGIDPSIFVALVTASGTGLGVVVGGLLRIAQEKRSRKILIQGSKGQKLEIPANMPASDIDLWIKRLKELESEIVKVSMD